MAQDRETCLKAGMDGYISKSFKLMDSYCLWTGYGPLSLLVLA